MRWSCQPPPALSPTHTRLPLPRFSAAKDAWEEVLRLEPSSSAAAEGVATCQSKLRETSAGDDDEAGDDSALGSSLPGGGGFPGMPGGFPGMPGGFPGMPGGFPGMPSGGGMPDMSELLRCVVWLAPAPVRAKDI